MNLIDLHVHSTASDGTLSPREIAFYAKDKGLSAISLTDHDTMSGVKECIDAGKEAGIEVIPGIELSASFNGKELHLLGYYMDYTSEALNEQLETLRKNRISRNKEILERLETLNVPLTLSELTFGLSKNTVITRAHIAKALKRKGYIQTMDEAFSKYIGDGKPAYVPKKQLTPEVCIRMIHEAGGFCVLAHPMLYGYHREEVTQLIKVLKTYGLDGVETLYSTHTKEDVVHLLQVCLNLKLFPTGGSDFHGANKPKLDLGCGYGELCIPSDVLKPMKQRLKSN